MNWFTHWLTNIILCNVNRKYVKNIVFPWKKINNISFKEILLKYLEILLFLKFVFSTITLLASKRNKKTTIIYMLFFDSNGKLNKPNSNKTLDSILRDPELEYAIKEYLIIQEEFNKGISLKDNVVFRDCFSELYDVNSRKRTLMNIKCANGFFDVFENIKRTNYSSEKDRYSDIVNKLHSNNVNTIGRDENEWVFASKILHTINNNMPIIDSHIVNMFGNVGIDIDQAKYIDFVNEFTNYVKNNNDEVVMIVYCFNQVYKNININPVKIIDFVLWIADKD